MALEYRQVGDHTKTAVLTACPFCGGQLEGNSRYPFPFHWLKHCPENPANTNSPAVEVTQR